MKILVYVETDELGNTEITAAPGYAWPTNSGPMHSMGFVGTQTQLNRAAKALQKCNCPECNAGKLVQTLLAKYQ